MTMGDPREEILRMLNEGVASIRGAISSRGITASGVTENGFKARVVGNHYQLVYDNTGAPLETLEEGRKPGKIPYGFVEIIERWSKEKGMSFPSDKERRRFAGAVAFGKIRQRGFGRPSPSDWGSRSETIYTPVIEDTVRELRREIPQLLINFFKNKTE